MTDFPNPPLALPFSIDDYSLDSAYAESAPLGGAAANASMTWVANLAQFVPVTVRWPFPVRRAFWINGSAITGTGCFAIYSGDGTQIFTTGSVAQAGASAPQYVTASPDFILPPGRYFFGYSNSGTTNVAFGTTTFTASVLRRAGVKQQATAHPLPATMASAVAPTQALYQFCGVVRHASGF